MRRLDWAAKQRLSYLYFSDIAPFCSLMPALTVALRFDFARAEDTSDLQWGHVGVTQDHGSRWLGHAIDRALRLFGQHHDSYQASAMHPSTALAN